MANYSENKAEKILDDMLEKVDTVIHLVSEKIPKTFPEMIAQSIFDGMRTTRDKLIKQR